MGVGRKAERSWDVDATLVPDCLLLHFLMLRHYKPLMCLSHYYLTSLSFNLIPKPQGQGGWGREGKRKRKRERSIKEFSITFSRGNLEFYLEF